MISPRSNLVVKLAIVLGVHPLSPRALYAFYLVFHLVTCAAGASLTWTSTQSVSCTLLFGTMFVHNISCFRGLRIGFVDKYAFATDSHVERLRGILQLERLGWREQKKFERRCVALTMLIFVGWFAYCIFFIVYYGSRQHLWFYYSCFALAITPIHTAFYVALVTATSEGAKREAALLKHLAVSDAVLPDTVVTEFLTAAQIWDIRGRNADKTASPALTLLTSLMCGIGYLVQDGRQLLFVVYVDNLQMVNCEYVTLCLWQSWQPGDAESVVDSDRDRTHQPAVRPSNRSC